jgi:hypothetical protein
MARTNGGTGTETLSLIDDVRRPASWAVVCTWAVVFTWVLVCVGLAVLVLAALMLMTGCSSGASPARTVITPGTAESTFTTTEDRGRTVIVRTAPPAPPAPCLAPRPVQPRVIVRVVPVGEKQQAPGTGQQ